MPTLVRLLEDADPGVRQGAAFAFGQMRQGAWEEAIRKLAKLLVEDSSPTVRQAAACALGRHAEAIAGEESGLPASILEQLTKALADENARVRQNAAWAIGQLGPVPSGTLPAADLVRLLRDPDDLVRRDAAGALGALGKAAKGSVATLLTCYRDDPEAVVRHAALAALVNAVGPEDRDAIPVLRQGLEEEEHERARAAAFAIANIGGAEAAAALPVLGAALRDADPEMRRLAAAALLRLGPHAEPAAPQLVHALGDAEATVRRTAALAIGRLGTRAREAIPELVRLLETDKHEEVRIAAAEGLALQSPNVEAAVPALQRAIKADSNGQVRVKAVIALGRFLNMGGPETAPLLEAALRETDPQSRLVRYNAAVVLALHQGPRATDATLDTLAALLEDEKIQIYGGTDARVRSTGTESASGEATIRRKYTGDGRILAARALAQVGPRAARPDILRSLEKVASASEPEIRQAAQDALRRIRVKD